MGFWSADKLSFAHKHPLQFDRGQEVLFEKG